MLKFNITFKSGSPVKERKVEGERIMVDKQGLLHICKRHYGEAPDSRSIFQDWLCVEEVKEDE